MPIETRFSSNHRRFLSQIEISKYPTLFLFPAYSKDHPIEYTGAFNSQAVISFVKTQLNAADPAEDEL